MPENIIKQARRAGIKIRPARPKPPNLTALMRALKVGSAFTHRFSHKQAPHAFARAAGVKVTTTLQKTFQNGEMLIEVARVE